MRSPTGEPYASHRISFARNHYSFRSSNWIFVSWLRAMIIKKVSHLFWCGTRPMDQRGCTINRQAKEWYCIFIVVNSKLSRQCDVWDGLSIGEHFGFIDRDVHDRWELIRVKSDAFTRFRRNADDAMRFDLLWNCHLACENSFGRGKKWAQAIRGAKNCINLDVKQAVRKSKRKTGATSWLNQN